MNGLIGITVLFYNWYVINRNRERGIVLYCVLALVLPVSYIFGVPVDYELLSFPVIVLLLLSKSSGRISVRYEYIAWTCWFIWMFIITVSSLLLMGKDAEIGWLSILGFLRCIIIITFLYKEPSFRKKFADIIRIVIFINVIAVTLELVLALLISDAYVIETRAQLYGTLGNAGALLGYVSSGRLDRFFGTFESSAFLGILSILGIFILGNEYGKGKTKARKIDFVAIIGSVYLGVMCSSKRFYLGIVAMSLFYFFVRSRLSHTKPKISRGAISRTVLLIVSGLVAFFVFYSYIKDRVAGAYYLGLLLKGRFMESLSSRFGENGAVSAMRNIIESYPITGVGNISINGVNITDSMLYVVLYMTGRIGLFFMAIFFVLLLRHVVRQKNIIGYIVYAVVLFEFVISTAFYSTLGIILLAYALSGTSNCDYVKQGFRTEKLNDINKTLYLKNT